MVLDKATEMVVGAFTGAVAAELLKPVIEEAKKVLAFKFVSEELASTMTGVAEIVTQIDLLEDVKELKDLKGTIDKAGVLVNKCSRVKCWNCFLKSYYFRKVDKINRKMLRFCQIQLPLILLKKQLESDGKRVYRYLCLVPQLKGVPIGFDWPLKELKKKVLDDSVDTVLVSAAPGCGKTTLVTQLCQDQEIKDKFQHIFFNVVSSAPDFRVLVQNLLQHNGYAPYPFGNEFQAIVGLQMLLEKLRISGRILLVLDDVWHGVEALLQKFPTNIPDLKILVTSRIDYPSFSSTIHLEPLENKYAEALLRKWALGPGHSTTPPEYVDLLPKILKHCNGFPLVIEVVGASLKGLARHLWRGQVESWSRRETILDNPTVLECLQPSFDALMSNLKDCFMDLGSFREDQKIRASVIIDIWVELYGTGGSMYMKDLSDLASQNLLKLIPLGGNEPEDGFYNEFLVTQHDILRDLAICQSKSEEKLERNRKRLSLEIRGDEYPNWCSILRQPINACLLSISTDDLFSSKWVGMKLMECPIVEALVLNLSSSNYALPDFIATMERLKVVIIINHGPNPTTLTNLSCFTSLHNLKRIRLEKVSITLLGILQLQLHSLKKLSLVMCSFGDVSHKEDIDVSLALPSLQEVDMDYCYDLVELPCWFSEVVSLKTLSITNCNKLTKLPEAIGKLSKLEVLRLKSCIELSELPETIERLSNLQSLDISDCLGLEKLPLEIGNLQKLKKISMRKLSRCELPESVKKLEDLEVKCDEESAFLWEKLKSKMKNLTVTVVETEHNLNLFKLF